jgi:hypothetical protein
VSHSDMQPEKETGGNAPRRTRTFNPLIKSQRADLSKRLELQQVPSDKDSPFPPIAHRSNSDDADLDRLIVRWPTLAPEVRKHIMELVGPP